MSDGGPRLVTVGMSTSVSCGARDHAKLLSGALERLSGEPSPMYWLERRDLSASGSRREIGRWTDQLALSLRAEAATVAVLHYSVFSYSHRGVPLFADRVLRTLRRSRVQVLTVLHEYAYPWQARDPRGNVWALTQRAALVDVLYTSDAALLTAELRVPWLSTRQWLPRRPIAVAPVFPNLPPPAPAAGEQRA
ncbi:MAG TPA: hypothetical protein VH025_09425, partial [Solirubrobacteraceae bacterium]|nr:hypothetical protein [Solirubrobacteraceae bacterium]